MGIKGVFGLKEIGAVDMCFDAKVQLVQRLFDSANLLCEFVGELVSEPAFRPLRSQ